MSSYVKATNFATKDTLPTGDANKIVKGTEIDNEFNAIAGAISSKSDIASPSFTGTPAAPTATSGSNTTQIANTAFVTAAVTDTVTSTTTFTNKTINLTSNTLVGTTAQFNTALSDDNFATIAGTETLTNKTLTSPTINTGTLASPTMTGTPVAPTAAAATNTTQVATTAHVFAERTNTATLTNKTLNLTSNTLTGTVAQFNTALSDDNFVTLTGTETLTNKTLTSPAISSPTISGVPTAPTATAGTNTTQLATTAFVTAALQAVYPVGSIYINAAVSTSPATLLGFGTWTAFGAGKVMVGLDSADTLFDTLEETGGSKDAIAVSHTHTASSTSTVTDPGHWHQIGNSNGVGASNAGKDLMGTTFNSPQYIASAFTGISVATSTTVNSAGSSGTNANLPPFIVVKMWKRTA